MNENHIAFDCIVLSIVSKPKSFEPPPRPTNPAPNRSVPPPKPAPPRPTPPATVTQHPNENGKPKIRQNADVNSVIPDISQPEVDLLNILPQSNSNNNNNANVPLPKEASFDLLGSFETNDSLANNGMPDLLTKSQTKTQGLDDIFGAFGQANNTNNTNLPALSSMGLDFSTANSSVPNTNTVNFDPFGGGTSFVGNSDVLRPTSTETSPSQSKQPPCVVQANKDPFADIGHLASASSLNLNWCSQATAGTSPHSTQYSSPTHQFGGFTTSASTAQPPPPPSSTLPSQMQQARSPMENPSLRPDYSRSHFEPKTKQNGTSNSSTPSASLGGDIFADILGQQGYNFATKSLGAPRSINEMRKEELVKDMDPDKLKIMEWVIWNFI